MIKDKRKKGIPVAEEMPFDSNNTNMNSSINDNITLQNKSQAKQGRADVKKVGRTRNFATVVYPESAPLDWMDRLDSYHVAALISPLHDRDINPSGEQKKPHYHVMLIFEGPKEFETQVKPIFDEIGGVGREKISSARGYARYLCHLDNPEKAQYDPREVKQFAGANYIAITQLPTDDVSMLKDIFIFIRMNGICSLAELLDITALTHPEWFSLVALSRAYIVDKYIKSLEWERTTNYHRTIEVDPETGEILNGSLSTPAQPAATQQDPRPKGPAGEDSAAERSERRA